MNKNNLNEFDEKIQLHISMLLEENTRLFQPYLSKMKDGGKKLEDKIDAIKNDLKQDINLTRLMVSATRDELKYEIGELRNEVRSLKKA